MPRTQQQIGAICSNLTSQVRWQYPSTIKPVSVTFAFDFFLYPPNGMQVCINEGTPHLVANDFQLSNHRCHAGSCNGVLRPTSFNKAPHVIRNAASALRAETF